MQLRQLRRFFGPVSLWPEFHPEATRSLLRSGFPVWIQALGGVTFGQFDRILLGVSLGAAAVAPYSLCVQFAQPIAGVTGSGLHFLFPYFSRRAGVVTTAALKRSVWKAFLCNVALVIVGAGLLLLFGNLLLRLWAGSAVAHSAATILPPIVLGSALLGLSVTGIYATQALGLFRIVASINLGGRAIMLLLMIYLLRHHGLQGLADSRVFYGAIALLVYIPLLHRLNRHGKATQPSSVITIPREVQEES
jgi:O-antigen/teichoic acid export membrane protein